MGDDELVPTQARGQASRHVLHRKGAQSGYWIREVGPKLYLQKTWALETRGQGNSCFDRRGLSSDRNICILDLIPGYAKNPSHGNIPAGTHGPFPRQEDLETPRVNSLSQLLPG